MSRRNDTALVMMALAGIATVPRLWPVTSVSAAAQNKACDLVTPGEVQAALGLNISTFTEGAGGFCSASAGNVTVMLRLDKGGPSSNAAKGIEMMKQMGGQVDIKTFGSTTCSTLVPPPNLAADVGFNTTCSVTKGEAVAAIEVAAKTQGDMVSIERLRPLAKKLRF